MNLPRCVGCDLPVLELRGQHMVLDSYLIEDGAPPEADVGAWHTTCLEASGRGGAWHQAQLRSYLGVRGYQQRATLADWVVVDNPRTGEVLALHRLGPLLGLTFAASPTRLVAGGGAYRVVEPDYGLHLGDAAWAREVQASLRGGTPYPMREVVRRLGSEARFHHPELLSASEFRYDAALAEEWAPTFVLAVADYEVFVPSELFSYVRIKP